MSYNRTWQAYMTLYRRPTLAKDQGPIALDRATCRIDDELRESAGHFEVAIDRAELIWKVGIHFTHVSAAPEVPDLKTFILEAVFLPQFEQLREDPGYRIGGRDV